ncbi:hypothetical protein PIB30_003207 [Stylosanthes scabra]|uniref:Uncharacterized protein n=1 Tax=Stylosanthes scabra TaxID=79078 RepID=A0ABU6Q331_9FABA|nr:hypothetical protein [Stylosanthes scabra]
MELLQPTYFQVASYTASGVLLPTHTLLFDFNLQAEAVTRGNKLGDSRSFGELGVAMATTPPSVSPHVFERVPDPDPHVGEALRPDDSDEESEFIEGYSDDDSGPVPPPKGGTSISGTHQYPPHLANLNFNALSVPVRRDRGSIC